MRAEVHRKHLTTEKLACLVALSAVTDTAGLAYQAARAVAAHDIAPSELQRLTATGAGSHDAHFVIVYFDGLRLPAKHQFDRWIFGQFGAQHGLHQHLLPPVRQLGRGPRSFAVISEKRSFKRLLARWNRKASELPAGQSGAVHHVLRVVLSQAQLANLAGKPATTIVLHGARRGGVRLRKVWCADIFLQHRAVHTAAA